MATSPVGSDSNIGFVTDSRTGVKIEIDESQLRKYIGWVNSTREWSREQEDYAIVVNKTSRRLDLYYDGEIDSTFQIGLGLNPTDDKFYEGDLSTPEGTYRVNWLRDGEEIETAFYKALMINYPTRQDSLEFIALREDGFIPEEVDSPGGHIEIHGYGGRSDWTLGCIAVDNSDMDYIFERSKLGTPVTIVKY